jgi:hypothetical protein
MADYRNVQTRMWRADEWFQDLPTDARLFWIYLFTNPSARVAGIYRLPAKTMAFETGIPLKRIRELMEQFAKDGKAYFESDVIWVVKMRDLQSPGKISPFLQVGIDADISEIPYCALKTRYLTHYGYPIDTLSIPATTTQHNTTQTKEILEEKTPAAPAVTATPPPLPKAVQEYLDNGGTFPKGKLADGTTKKDKATAYIAEHIRGDPESIALWGRVVAGYTAQWASASYMTMINDYYLQGRIPGTSTPRSNGNGYNHSNGRPQPQNAEHRPDPQVTDALARAQAELNARLAS